jgi:hypothetical protein
MCRWGPSAAAQPQASGAQLVARRLRVNREPVEWAAATRRVAEDQTGDPTPKNRGKNRKPADAVYAECSPQQPQQPAAK